MLARISTLLFSAWAGSSACVGPVVVSDVRAMDMSPAQQAMLFFTAGTKNYFVEMPTEFRSEKLSAILELEATQKPVYVKELPIYNNEGYQAVEGIFYYSTCDVAP